MRTISFMQNGNLRPKYTLLDQVASILLVLLPLLQHYKSFFQEASTVLMLVLFCYFGIRLLQAKEWHFQAVLPLIALSLFEVVNHGFGLSEFAREMLLVAYYVTAASRVISLKAFSRAALCIAATASVLIILQYFCYYVLDFHLQLVATSWLKESAEQWILLAQTGRISVSGNWMSIYRPSAFFLEPSHFTLFCFPSLVLVLLNYQASTKRLALAILLSVGIFLTTSGMGIVLVMATWGLFLLHHLMGDGSLTNKLKNLIQPRALLIYGIVLAALVIAYFALPPFRAAINRIFVASSETGKNAIGGRMSTGIKAISGMSGWEIWFGKQHWGNVHKWNMAGFFYTFYTQGLFGTLISYGFYVQCLFRLKGERFWLALMVIGLSFVSLQTHAAFYMLFFVLLLLDGYDETQDKWKINNALSHKFKRKGSDA